MGPTHVEVGVVANDDLNLGVSSCTTSRITLNIASTASRSASFTTCPEFFAASDGKNAWVGWSIMRNRGTGRLFIVRKRCSASWVARW